jgi:hypothetical protein
LGSRLTVLRLTFSKTLASLLLPILQQFLLSLLLPLS